MILSIQNFKTNSNHKIKSTQYQKTTPQLNYLSKFSNLQKDEVSFGKGHYDYPEDEIINLPKSDDTVSAKKTIDPDFADLNEDARTILEQAKYHYPVFKKGKFTIASNPEELKIEKPSFNNKMVSIQQQDQDILINIEDSYGDYKTKRYKIDENGNITKGPKLSTIVGDPKEKDILADYVNDLLYTIKDEIKPKR